MIVTNYTSEDLKRLPLRAIVALAARCARRVERQARLSEDHPEKERCRAAVASAIRLAEDFAKGLPSASSESVIREVEACRAFAENDFVRDWAIAAVVLAAHATAAALQPLDLRGEADSSHSFGAGKSDPIPHLADVEADLAVPEAFTAALGAVGADGHSDTLIKGAVDDYERLLRLDLGSYPQAGKPIDPGSKGPLGSLGLEESIR